jgi:hypothetical protein
MEKTIIELIIQDIKHNQLVNGLYEIGLNDDDKYLLKIDCIVAELSGINKHHINDEWLSEYQKTMLNVNSHLSDEEIRCIATDLFYKLQMLV